MRVGQSLSADVPTKSRKDRDGREQRKCQERSDCRKNGKKSRGVSVSEEKRLEETTQSNTSLPGGSKVPLEF